MQSPRPSSVIRALFVIAAATALAYYLGLIDRILLYRYGLEVTWSYGASSTVPCAIISAKWKDRLVECPFFFGGIDDPDLHLRIINWTDANLIFGNNKKEIIVSFTMGTSESAPKFLLIKDTSGQHLNN